jgi:hypothetical protein
MSDRSVTTIIVNWNTPTLSIEAAQSAFEATPEGIAHRVVVVDNASEDDSLRALATSGLPVEVVANGDNRGFAAANNQGFSMAESEYVLLLNSDARLETGALSALVERMERSPRAAVVGSRLVYADERFQRWTAGREPSLGSCAVYLLGLDRLAPFGTSGTYLGRDVARAFRPDWVSAACMLCRREAVIEVGLMDERYFYMEDVDLCRRLRLAGYEIWYEPTAVAVHLMGESTRKLGSGAPPVALQSFNHYFAEHHSAAAGVALRALEVAGFGARSAAHAAASARGRDRARHLAEARAHFTRMRKGHARAERRERRGTEHQEPPGGQLSSAVGYGSNPARRPLVHD